MGTQAPTYTLAEVFNTAVVANRAIAAWRLPHAASVQVCISLQDDLFIGQPVLENSAAGFLFCPFQVGKYKNSFIKADLEFDPLTGIVFSAPDAPVAGLKEFYTLLAEPTNNSWHLPESIAQLTSENYTAVVQQSIAAIEAGEMEKVVISRNQKQQLPENFSPVATFNKLLESYPEAFVSLVSVPGIGTWLGATPEILVSIDADQVFHTMALAGTQPATEKVNDAIWRQKEIEEQGMVERYILSCFKKLRLREYTEIGPRTIKAGNLLHLRTDFKVDLKEVDYPALGSEMLQLLHPTSAICGLPKEPALQFILAREGYDRSYYSGYFGPVNCAAGTSLFVNLRCMQLLSHEAILYAGAGITSESDPEKEWHETQHKMNTIGSVLNG
ncbi:chorismate-binding protein [Pontibacter arcticus]|uniref:Isochorismate synthase n=1 Tax=Pontibacter arcticus TaxID=2080288 RepID=A0A364RGE3_9BACT|nr:chorismate-binding protein [Pontibacter arcticus]RAU83369.1 isochorismate synthase [Pontibacter arcticus]